MIPEVPAECDVAVVGAGPAGLAAATALRTMGVGSVVVLDREADAGGIPRHCGHSPFGMREFGRVLLGPAYARRLVEQAKAAGVSIHTGVTVTALRPGPRLEISDPSGVREIDARRVLLATGVRERSRASRLIGGTKPGGVISTGALQGFVHLQKLRPFRRPVVLGTELVSFSALLTCHQAGIRPLMMIEPGPRVTARWPAALLPPLLGASILLETELNAIEGEANVSAVELRDGSGAIRRVATDGVIVTGQFQPEASLLRMSHLALDSGSGGPEIDQFGRCSDPDYFAAGNLLRPVETAGWSWKEGRLTAEAIVRSLAGDLPSSAAGLRLASPALPLRYALPHRVVLQDGRSAPHDKFQLRVSRAARGRLSLLVDGAEVWSKRLSALPERRLTVPLSVLSMESEGQAEFVLTET